MGTYLYGITAQHKNVIGSDEQVNLAKYICKPYYGFGETPAVISRIIGRYENSPFRGNLVVMDKWEIGNIVYDISSAYTFPSNVIPDVDWTPVGFLVKRGRSWAMESMDNYQAWVETQPQEKRIYL